MFANERWFNDPQSRLQSMGYDTRVQNAVVDQFGQPIIYTGTGGILSPERFELRSGSLVFRFGASDAPVTRIVLGQWWLHRDEFDKVISFSEQNGLNIGMAARILCCVPPEWSDMGTLVRARVREPLLAYRGLAKDVVTPADDSHGNVKMAAHNNIDARRLHQLFIPGLPDVANNQAGRVMQGSMIAEQCWDINTEHAKRGFLYL